MANQTSTVCTPSWLWAIKASSTNKIYGIPLCVRSTRYNLAIVLLLISQTAEFAVVQNENGIPEEDTVEYFLDDHERVDVILPKSQPRSRM